MDANDLCDGVKREIVKLIEPTAWQLCEIVNRAEQGSLKSIFKKRHRGHAVETEN
jgi:hypothetical protein